MKAAVALRLGRISNLPTVWTNVMTGALLAGGAMVDPRLPLLMLAMSLFYVGGMFLNDAFDREFDAVHRPDRPIPAGEVTARQVFTAGFGLLALGALAVAAVGRTPDGDPPWRAMASSAALAAAIVFYDAHHKTNPLSPLVMGLCRVLVVATASYAVADALPAAVAVAAAALLCHLIGLTYIAKQEHLDQLGRLWPLGFLGVPLLYGAQLAVTSPAAWAPWLLYVVLLVYAMRRLRRRRPGDVPHAVVTLIAAMAVLDALLLAGHGHHAAATFAVGAFVLTLALQRWVSGT